MCVENIIVAFRTLPKKSGFGVASVPSDFLGIKKRVELLTHHLIPKPSLEPMYLAKVSEGFGIRWWVSTALQRRALTPTEVGQLF